MKTIIAGEQFEFDAADVERAAARLDPEPINEHYVLVGGRRFPPKQLLDAVTGLDRADFTTHQARRVLRRLGFAAYRRSRPSTATAPMTTGARQHAEAETLASFTGRWVAQDGLEVLFDAESFEDVVVWLRRHDRTARVWRVPGTPGEAGSASATP